MKLTHVGISNFRSIGEEPVMIDLTKKINVLVGANNCGKSNMLRAVCSFGKRTENEIDHHLRTRDLYPIHWVEGLADADQEAFLHPIGRLKVGWQQIQDADKYVSELFADMDWQHFEPIWQKFNPGSYFHGRPSQERVLQEKMNICSRLWQDLTAKLPKASLVPQFRQITDTETYSIEGAGIVKVLWRWQHPPIGSEPDRLRFMKVQGLLRSLIQQPEVTLEVDHSAHLLRINQHSAILIDSDRRKKTASLNSTKLRVQQECAASNILCWITDGREIENYLPADALAAAYAELAGSKPELRLQPFDDIESVLKKSLQKSWPRANYYHQAKPQMARRIAPHMSKASLSLDLVTWMEKLVSVIRHEAP